MIIVILPGIYSGATVHVNGEKLFMCVMETFYQLAGVQFDDDDYYYEED
jgi:hypothetical protein